MNKEILKNKLLKDFIDCYNGFKFKKGKMNKRGYNPDIFICCLTMYIEKKTKSKIVKKNDYINKCIFIECTEKTTECKLKRIRKMFSINCEDIINKVPNAKEVENELKSVLKYLCLENKIEVTATYDKELYYSFRMTVEFLNKKDEKIKEKKSKLLKNVASF